jgi:DNA invertase Pin-like site-specific DNA recombinase
MHTLNRGDCAAGSRGLCRIVSVQEPWLDTGGPTRHLLLSIFGWVAEQERARLVERTRAGVERARRAGPVGGRPRALNTDQATRVCELRAAGRSWSQIAAEMLCTPSAAHRAAIRLA